ncbi:unnamed protein product [Moneuplotes crassus]|uniref:C2H2-type domain-containing protein n=1 Tax=Euplotes crassus TaxID=5936 RepID=A0AAD1XC95_EUPCR|nr:unnamed protein product [Moneuplotes crassus]
MATPKTLSKDPVSLGHGQSINSQVINLRDKTQCAEYASKEAGKLGVNSKQSTKPIDTYGTADTILLNDGRPVKKIGNNYYVEFDKPIIPRFTSNKPSSIIHDSCFSSPTMLQLSCSKVPNNLEFSKTKEFSRRNKSNKGCKNGEYCTCGLSKDEAYLVNYLLKKSNLGFMQELQNFRYELIQKRTPLNKKKYFQFVCKFEGNCNAKFTRSWNFLDHCRMHYGIRPYQCDQCERSFTQKGNLKSHKLTH